MDNSTTMIRVDKKLRDELLILRITTGKGSIEEVIRDLLKTKEEAENKD